jgi:hypothetical protein
MLHPYVGRFSGNEAAYVVHRIFFCAEICARKSVFLYPAWSLSDMVPWNLANKYMASTDNSLSTIAVTIFSAKDKYNFAATWCI